jgi:hypothetical protein
VVFIVDSAVPNLAGSATHASFLASTWARMSVFFLNVECFHFLWFTHCDEKQIATTN